jgi:hypothetical protein
MYSELNQTSTLLLIPSIRRSRYPTTGRLLPQQYRDIDDICSLRGSSITTVMLSQDLSFILTHSYTPPVCLFVLWSRPKRYNRCKTSEPQDQLLLQASSELITFLKKQLITMKFNLQFSLCFAFFNEAFVLANTCDHDVGYNPILGTSTYFEGSSCILEYIGMQACSCNGADIVRLQIP